MSYLGLQRVVKGSFEDSDPGEFIETGFKSIDANFAAIDAAIEQLATNLNPDNTGWRYFSGGGVDYRAGADIDGYFKIQQALTAIGFNGTESVDDGATGDYITLVPYKFV
jgi:hypothetical protein